MTAASFLENWWYGATSSHFSSGWCGPWRCPKYHHPWLAGWTPSPTPTSGSGLGLPRCFSDTGLFGKNALQLPLKSINLGYKQEKTRLVFELKESRDEAVKRAGVTIRTRYRWKAQQEIDQAVNRLQHKEVMGRVQHSRTGLGWGEPVQFWSKATREQRKSVVVEEVSQVEQDRYLIKAVSQCKQGAWTRWEDISNRVITWADIWRTPQSRLSFLVRAAYDTLPCPQNLSQWFGSEDKCPLCNKANAGLQHILSGCNVALTQGRFRWRHNQVLRKLAELLERCRVRANSSPVTLHPNVPFLRPGEGGQKTVARRTTCLLTPGKGWEMRVDLGTQLIFPTEITQTTLRPDAVVWATAAKKALIIELTVPWEEGIQAAHEFKRLKYSDLAAECREGGWTTTIHPVEVGCRGFRNPASPSCWDNRDKPEETHQGAGGGGREGKLLVEATEEGHELGLGQLQGMAGRRPHKPLPPPPPHREMYWIGGETSVNGGTSWRPCSWPKGALEEVRQAEMSSRKHHLYIEMKLKYFKIAIQITSDLPFWAYFPWIFR